MGRYAYGLVRQRPDPRDRPFLLAEAPVPTPPPKADLRGPLLPPVWDQGQLGSCTAHAAGAAFEYAERKQGLEDYSPSRLGLYYATRALTGQTAEDAGAAIRDAMKAVNATGCGHEALWPYEPSKFADRPPDAYFADAAKHTGIEYLAVPQTGAALKAAIASGYPVVLGILVHASFEAVGADGLIPMPTATDPATGGHAVALVGYDDAALRYVLRNSWGTSWGDQGYGYLPYNYAHDADLTFDPWCLRKVAG